MGFLRQLLPPSSRSFHNLYRELLSFRDKAFRLQYQVVREQREAAQRGEERIDALNEKVSALEGQVQELRMLLDAHDTHSEMFSWALFRREGEDYNDARKRFFLELPPAQDGMRLLQLGCAQLLAEFDALCTEHGLNYWVVCGTLIGAVRHRGFIPWDDDMDVGMPRADILRLQEIVARSDRYRITVVFDRYVYCRQVRFCYKDARIPCFIDLFIYDYTSSVDESVLMRQRKRREDMIAEAKESPYMEVWNYASPYLSADCPSGEKVDALFRKYEMTGFGEHGDMERLPCDGGGLIWAFDNLDDFKGHGWRLVSSDDVFPLRRMEFEGRSCNAPHNYNLFLKGLYGDVYRLPDDINSHFDHFDHGVLSDEGTLGAIEGMLQD